MKDARAKLKAKLREFKTSEDPKEEGKLLTLKEFLRKAKAARETFSSEDIKKLVEHRYRAE